GGGSSGSPRSLLSEPSAPEAPGARRTSISKSDGGLSSSTDISPPGAAITQVTDCWATNDARVPAGDHSPNSATARACAGSRPRAARVVATAAPVQTGPGLLGWPG